MTSQSNYPLKKAFFFRALLNVSLLNLISDIEPYVTLFKQCCEVEFWGINQLSHSTDLK